MSEASLREIQDYYGKVLRTSNDLRTDACTTIAAPPAAVRRALSNVHPEVSARYFGCGLVAPQALDGCRVLDLGSGSGRDAYVLAQLVGQRGAIIGVDATPEQLAVARTHEEWHRRRFAFDRSNVTFIEGDIARLAELDLTPRSFDVVFLDPPFGGDWLDRALPLVVPLVREDGFLYVESGAPLDLAAADALAGWAVVRQGKAGAVHYHLLQRENGE